MIAAATTLAAAPVLAWSATAIAERTGLGGTLVGTVLVGGSTSLPELVATIAALRIGAHDLAVGNLFGSNAFNMALLLCLDAAQPGNLFASVDPHHAISGLIAVVLMTIGLAGIVYRAEHRFTMSEPTSALMAIAYLFGVATLFGNRP
jgi:cation:H+ antiporter